jgi:hypothetical protein
LNRFRNDPCYHEACDDISNPSTFAFDQFSDAAADAVFEFAMTTSAVNGSGKTSSSSSKYDFKGLGAHQIERNWLRGARFVRPSVPLSFDLNVAVRRMGG